MISNLAYTGKILNQMIKNRIPNEGNAENMIQRLRSYIEPVNTAWFQELKSASDENIEKWKKHLGLEEKKLDFPPTYLEFLRYAGEGDGGLFEKTIGVKMSIESQFPYYRHVYINECDRLRPYYFEFMTTFDYNIPYLMNVGEKNNKIYFGMEQEFSGSFEKLVFQCAIQIYEHLYFSSYESIWPTVDIFDDFDVIQQGKKLFPVLDKIVEKHHLQKAWFSDDLMYFAYTDEMSLLINCRELGFRGILFYNQKEKVKNIKASLISEVGVEFCKE